MNNMITNNMMLSSTHVTSDSVIFVVVFHSTEYKSCDIYYKSREIDREKKFNYNSICIPLSITFFVFLHCNKMRLH